MRACLGPFFHAAYLTAQWDLPPRLEPSITAMTSAAHANAQFVFMKRIYLHVMLGHLRERHRSYRGIFKYSLMKTRVFRKNMGGSKGQKCHQTVWSLLKFYLFK